MLDDEGRSKLQDNRNANSQQEDRPLDILSVLSVSRKEEKAGYDKQIGDPKGYILPVYAERVASVDVVPYHQRIHESFNNHRAE